MLMLINVHVLCFIQYGLIGQPSVYDNKTKINDHAHAQYNDRFLLFDVLSCLFCKNVVSQPHLLKMLIDEPNNLLTK